MGDNNTRLYVGGKKSGEDHESKESASESVFYPFPVPDLIQGLSYDTRDDSFKTFFEQWGAVEDVKVIMDRETGNCS